MTALKRLESERGLGVHEGTIDQVRRALEAAGILFIESGQGRGVMLLNETSDILVRQGRGRGRVESS
ncbi:XRE family transcriptional regulator [Acetobacter fabarum]